MKTRIKHLRGDQYRELKSKVLAYKEKVCKDCGVYDLPDCCYDFHHRNPRAKFWDVSYLISVNAAWDDLIREVDKCDVVCANCHRTRTWEGKSAKLVKQKMSQTLIQQHENLMRQSEDAMSHRTVGSVTQ